MPLNIQPDDEHGKDGRRILIFSVNMIPQMGDEEA